MSKQVIQAAAIKSVDEQLTEYLLRAEESLIAAVELFSNGTGPVRPSESLKRLTRAQEMVTMLLREELVRRRGPIKFKRK